MKAKFKTVMSLGYWFSALSLGLLLHPYATLRRMVRDKLLRPLVALPVVSSIFLWLATAVAVRVGRLVLGVAGVGLPYGVVGMLGFLFWWVVVFLGLWQVVLTYLMVRFWVVIGDLNRA